MTLNKALFLDRDGVINHDYNYVHKQENFDFVDGVFELVDVARTKNYKIIIVTNQAGIGRKFYTEAQFHELMDWVKTRLNYDKVYFCPHHPDDACKCRKPAPGMILQARDEFKLDLAASILIGDRETDVLAAKNAGIGTKILLNTTPDKTEADHIIQSLKDAHKYL